MELLQDTELFEYLKRGGNPNIKFISNKQQFFDLITENILIIGEIENTIREHYKTEFGLKKKHTFDNSPILREKVLEFIEKCYTGQAFFYKKIGNQTDEYTFNCRKCGTELNPDTNYCLSCRDFIEPISEDYKRRGKMDGKTLIDMVGGDFDRYGMSLSSQITPMQSKLSNKLNSIGIDIAPKDVPSGIRNMKDAEKWIKSVYSRILLFDTNIQLKYMQEFNKTDAIKLQNELKDIILNSPKTFSESAHQVLSGEIKSAILKAKIDEELYRKIILKLRNNTGGNLLSGKGFILDDVNLAILDWSVNNISKTRIVSKYKLSTKKGQLDNMVARWIELGIITPPEIGRSGPQLTPEYQ
jgi:hypothetical protein